MGETGTHAEAAPENLIDYNIDDTYHGFILKKKFTPMMEKEGMTNFFHTLQMPLERTLTKMSYRGFTMDRGGIIDLSNKYREQIILKEQELWDTCQKQFSYSSGSRDLPVILFKDLAYLF
jgi:DNA polymerase I-like protein with 3'-5' exonuclease and polymerase domains